MSQKSSSSHTIFLTFSLPRIRLVALASSPRTTRPTPTVVAVFATAYAYEGLWLFGLAAVRAGAERHFVIVPVLVPSTWVSPLPRAPRSTRLATAVEVRR